MTLTPRRRVRMTNSLLARMGQEAGLLTAQVRAEALGISKSHLHHIERGEHFPSPAIVDEMAQAYHKTIEQVERAAKLQVERLAERKLAFVRGID